MSFWDLAYRFRFRCGWIALILYLEALWVMYR